MSREVGQVIFSHGFATSKESRGLFTVTGDMLEECGFDVYKFNYNGVTDDGDFIIRTFDEQTAKLERMIERTDVDRPLIVVAHSRGNTPVSRARNISRACRVIAAVPVWNESMARFESSLKARGAEMQMDGSATIRARQSGGNLIVPKEYIDGIDTVDALADYKNISSLPDTKLTIIRAMEDRDHPPIDLSHFHRGVQSVDFLHADHNFTGSNREVFASIITGIALRSVGVKQEVS